MVRHISHESAPNPNALAVGIRDACRLTGIGRSLLYRLIGEGRIGSVKAGKRRLVLVESLRSWLASLPPA
jgi:excisionase family DNA binding protein